MPSGRLIIQTVAAGFAVVGSALIFKEEVLNRKKLRASWTTHHNTPEPQYKWDHNWDLRKPVEKAKLDESGDKACVAETPTATRHIFLIRHGQYNMDSNKDEDRILTALGREQAVQTGKRLKALDLPFSRMVYSTMARAQETGKIISDQLSLDLPVEHCSMLREGAPIPPEPPIGGWTPEASFYQDGARIEAAFRKYFHRADVTQKETSYEVLVCHANVIRYFACRSLQLPPEAWLRMSLHHGSITWLTIRPSGRVGIRALGDCGFMDKDMLTIS